MNTKNDKETAKKSKKRRKGDSVEDEEQETARLLSEDPMDWMLKNEKVSNMLSVRKALKTL